MIEDIHEDGNKILHLKISSPPGEKELQSCIPLILNHLVNGAGYVLQVGENFQLSAVLQDDNKPDIMGQIKILSTTKEVTSTVSVTLAIIDGTQITTVATKQEFRNPDMDRLMMKLLGPPRRIKPNPKSIGQVNESER